MKTNWVSGWVMMLAGLPLVAGNLQGADTNGSMAATIATNAPLVQPTNLPAEEPPAPPVVKLTQSAEGVVRLAQAGLGDDVMLAYIGNMMSKFNLGSDQIVYLNDLGVSGAVVKAMIERDSAIESASQAAFANLVQPNLPPQMPPPTAPSDDSSIPTTSPPDDTLAAGPPAYPDNDAQPNDADYFYNSLAPYGSWVFVSGCGLCWQPTVCLANHDWRPYGDRGRWLASDCGWYWQSDYSWGWAPFHYGRWFNDAGRGWCWAPDRTWGPAWVSWRRSTDICGWAPLPPSARFLPGAGFVYANHLAAAGFEFGLQSRNYTFIPIARLSDYAPTRYSVPKWQRDEVFGQTGLINHFSVRDNRVVDQGIDPKEVSAVAHTEIREAHIRELPHDSSRHVQSDRLAKTADGMVIYHPQLPAPSARRGTPTTSHASPGAPAVRTSLQVSAPRPASAPLPNMNFSHLAGQNTTTYQPVRPDPTARPGNYGNFASTQTPQAPDYSRPTPGFNFNLNRPAQNETPNQFQPAQNQRPYVMPGRFTVPDQMRAATPSSPNYSALERIRSEQAQNPGVNHNYGSYVAPGHFNANDRITPNVERTTPSPANAAIANARSQVSSFEPARESHVQSQAAPAPRAEPAPSRSYSAPASSSSQQQQSSSTGHK